MTERAPTLPWAWKTLVFVFFSFKFDDVVTTGGPDFVITWGFPRQIEMVRTTYKFKPTKPTDESA